METLTNRAEGEKPGLAIAFSVVRDHLGFFPNEGLDDSEINPVFGEVGFALRFVPFVHLYLIVYTKKVEVNRKEALRRKRDPRSRTGSKSWVQDAISMRCGESPGSGGPPEKD